MPDQRHDYVEHAPGGDIHRARRVTAEDLEAALNRIGDAYGRIPAGEPTREEVDAALPGLYEVIGEALLLIDHPFAPAPKEA